MTNESTILIEVVMKNLATKSTKELPWIRPTSGSIAERTIKCTK